MIQRPPPRIYQTAALEKGRDRQFFAYFMKYGTGKSRVLIDNVIHLYREKRSQGLLVVAPKGVYRNWSSAEIPIHMEADIPYRVGWYDATGGKSSRDSLAPLFEGTSDLRILLVNVESLSTQNGVKLCIDFLRQQPTLMAVDESTTIKTPTAQRTKTSIKLGRFAAYTRILTGDPYANSPIDIYSQFEFLEPGSLGYTSFIAFKKAFCILGPVPGAPRWVTRVLGYRNLDKLKRLVEPHAFFCEKPDDLPPKIYLPPREASMTPKQKQVYDDMRKYSMAEIGRQMELKAAPEPEASLNDLQDPTTVQAAVPMEQPLKTANADIVLTQMLRLQQIACGFVKTEDGSEEDLCDGHNPRVAETVQMIEEMGPKAKVIIWAPFRPSIKALKEALSEKYGPETVVTYDGDTSADDREKAKLSFQDPAGSVRYFLSNQATGGRGNTLTQASSVIYFSNLFDNELRANSEDRPHRLGLDHSVTYQDVVSAPIDTKTREALLNKRTISDMLRDGSWRDLFQK